MNTYAFSFRATRNATKRIQWIRLGNHMEAAFTLAKFAALKDYPEAHSFSIAECAP